MISKRWKCENRTDTPFKQRVREGSARLGQLWPRAKFFTSYISFSRQRGAELFWTLATILVLSCGGCQTPAPVLSEQMGAPTKVTLVPGDVIKLSFPAAPDLNQSQKIQTDGKINLPLIGEVTAAGRSIATLQEELTARYKPQVKDSSVVVTLESSVTQVVVSGAVSKPAKLIFDRPTTVFQAIMEAGGTTEYGNLKNVHLVRLVHGQQRTQILDLRSTLGGSTTRPVYVRDGDVIYIPQTFF
ncbi:MAG: polysaccharide biosynthesis/export family protein [Verrucomicrobiota bacterium]